MDAGNSLIVRCNDIEMSSPTGHFIHEPAPQADGFKTTAQLPYVTMIPSRIQHRADGTVAPCHLPSEHFLQ